MPTIDSYLKSGVFTLKINRPPVNALDMETILSLLESIKEAAEDNSIGCIVLTGSNNVFSAGHDIQEMLIGHKGDISYREHLKKTYNPLILQIRNTLKPIIACINGPAAGAGLGIALACDLRIAVESAYFSVGFSRIGLVPDSGVSLFLPILIGLGRATERSFSNEPFSSIQALEWGLINQVVQEADLENETSKLAIKLAEGPTSTFGLTKQAYNRSILPNLETALDHEANLQEKARKGEEHLAGVKAFLEN